MIVKEVAAPSLNGKHAPIAQPAKPPLAFVGYDDLMSMELPPREWVVANVFPVGLLSAITAESGAGKTWLALTLLRAIAGGKIWAGKYLCVMRTCALLDLEGNYGRLRDRLIALDSGIGRLDAATRANIHFLSDLGRINIMDTTTRQQIINAVRDRGIEVLFVDTLVRVHQFDENSADMSQVLEALERVARDTGCTVIVLHHTGKGSGGKAATSGRGSSAIKAALQHEVMLTRETDKTIKVSLTKAKCSPEVDRLTTMRIEAVEGVGGVNVEFTDEEVSIHEPHRPSAKNSRRKIVTELLTDAPLTYTALTSGTMAKAQCSRSSATNEIAAMEHEGLIAKQSDGRYNLC